MPGSFLEKIKMFVSDDALLNKFIKCMKKICEIEQCTDGCDLRNFCWSLKVCFEKENILLDKKKKNYWTVH